MKITKKIKKMSENELLDTYADVVETDQDWENGTTTLTFENGIAVVSEDGIEWTDNLTPVHGIKFESRAARLAEKLGYTHIASVVKSHYASTYYNVVTTNYVISTGAWPAAPHNGNYRIGTIESDIDWTVTIARATLHDKLRESEQEVTV